MSYLVKDFRRLAGKAVHQYQMISHGDRVLVGLSGGKDSLALLWFLDERRRRAPIDYSLAAAHLDMGYEDAGQRAALQVWVKDMGLEHLFEHTDFAPRAHSQFNRKNPCFLCSRLRRRRLFELARDHGCNKVALGHHRDDLIETLLMNILYSGEISTMLPVQELFKGLLTVIRPLCMVTEDRVSRVARALGLPVVENRCPSANRSKREEVKAVIARLAHKNDKVKGNIFRALSNVRTDYLLGPGSPLTAMTTKESARMEEDQRRRTRVDFTTTVTLVARERELKGLTTRNVSLKGLLAETDEKLPLSEPVDILLELSGTTSLLALKMKGHVARVDETGLGVDFSRIDPDSLFHLHSLVSLRGGSGDGRQADV